MTDDCRQFPLSGHAFCQQLHVLLFFVCSACQVFVVVVDDLFRVVHAAVSDLDGVAIEDFTKLVVSREVIVY